MSSLVRRATLDDSAFLSWVIREASRSHLERGPLDAIIPNPQDLSDIIEWMTISEVPSSCLFNHFFIAERAGRPAAAAAGFDPAAPGLDSLMPALADAFCGLGFADEALQNAMQSMASYRACSPSLTPGIWTLEWIATVPEQRHSGLCTILVEHLLAEGVARGFRTAQVSVLIDNDKARRVYEAAGFKTAEERRHPDFERAFGAPGMLSLRRELTANDARVVLAAQRAPAVRQSSIRHMPL